MYDDPKKETPVAEKKIMQRNPCYPTKETKTKKNKKKRSREHALNVIRCISGKFFRFGKEDVE
jgi:hypothetical protein